MRRFLIAGLLTPLLAVAQQPAEAPEPPPPPPPGVVPEGSDIEPEVTITERDGDVVHEYSVNGRVYMVKIVPAKGPPYYLLDSDGDGSLETYRNELDPPEVQQWILFQW